MVTRGLDTDTFDYAFNEDGSGGFNSRDDLEVIVNHVSKPLAPAMSESYQDVPARYGGVYLGTNYGEKQIDIPITIMAEDREEYNRKLENLTNVLINTADDADTQYPIRFNDNPDVMYYGHFTEIPTPTFINDGVQDCTTTLTFMMADPRGFLPTKNIKLSNNNQEIVPEGNERVNPIIHIIPKTDLYYFGYETEDKYVAVGYNVDRGNTVTDANGNVTIMGQHQKLQVNDPCTTMATWFEAGPETQTIKPYKGELDGHATATGTALMVGKDKDGHYNWGAKGKHKGYYGPVIIHNGLPRITPYWKVSVRLHHVKQKGPHNSRAMGKVEAYLLDNDGNIRGRMGIEDPSHGRMPVAYIQLGTSFDSKNDKGKYKTIFFNRGNKSQQTNEATTSVKIPFKKVEVKPKKKSSSGKTSGHSTTSKPKSGTSKTKRSRYNDMNRFYYGLDMDLQTFATKKKTPSKKKTTAKKKPTKKVAKKTVKAKSGGKKKGTVKKPTSTTKSKKQKKYIETYKNEISYNNADAYSDFYGEFTLERYRKDSNGKSSNMYKASIVQWSVKNGEPYDATTGKHTSYTKTITADDKFSFALANVAVYFAKHDITEDLASPAVGYKTAFETLTNYKAWSSDGNDDPDDVPHVIAHAGEEIIIDTENNNVTCNGNSLNKYVSWLSTFPQLTGGVPQTIHFEPAPENADITLEYKPAIK